MRLYHKINSVALSVLVLVSLTITWSAIGYMDDLAAALNERFMQSQISRLVGRIDHDYQVLYEKGLTSSLSYTKLTQDTIIRELLHEGGAATTRIGIYDSSGRPLVHESRLAEPGDALAHLEQLRNAPGRMLLFDNAGRKRFYIADIANGWDWTVVLSMDSAGLFAWRNEFLLRSMTILFASTLAGAVVFLLLSRRIVRPLQALVQAAESIEAEGWHNNIACIASRDEVGQLSRAFSRMAHSRQRAEERLRQSEEQYRLLASNVHDVIWTMDQDFRFTYFSPSIHRVLGYTPEEILHLSLDEWVVAQYLPLFQEKALERRRQWDQGNYDETHTFELALIHKDGTMVWAEVSSSTLLDESGAPAGLVGVSRDITKRRQLELQKDSIDKMIRHDLKHPLVGIISLPELLLMSQDISEQDKEVLRIIQNSGKKMLQLIDSSLALYRIEAGNHRLQLQRFDLAEELRSIKVELASHLETYGLELQLFCNGIMGCPEPGLVVCADPVLFPFMLANLIKNAMEASPPGNVVTVRVNLNETGREDEAGELEISVHNIGAVPEAVRGNFFEKFVTYGKKSGTGLGTYSARLITQAHGGEITMQTSEQTGTLVTVRLPQQPEACS